MAELKNDTTAGHAPRCCAAAADPPGIRETVRARYAAAAVSDIAPCCTDDSVFGAGLYSSRDAATAGAALGLSLGCGIPTQLADLHQGETVLDLGSGAGTDLLIAAERVGPTGRVIGVDMTDEMLERARLNIAAAGAANVEVRTGYIEDLPLADASVDVVISNCVVNLSADKHAVFREASRVLRPGGRLAISDVIADDDMDDATRADIAAWTGCIAGALTAAQVREELRAAGFTAIEVVTTHRVHEHAAAASIRARRP